MVAKSCVICGTTFDAKRVAKVCSEECRKSKEKALRAKYRVENPDREKAKYARYRAKYPDVVKARKVRWCSENPEKVKAQRARAYAKDPEKAKAQVTKNWRKRRAAELNGKTFIAMNEIMRAYNIEKGKSDD